MKIFLMVILGIGLLAGCNKLDPQTEVIADRILASDFFECYTYQASCIGGNKITISHMPKDSEYLTVSIKKSELKKLELTPEKIDEIKQILRKGYNRETPTDNASGSLNRYYWFLSKEDSIFFCNNDESLYYDYLQIMDLEASFVSKLK